MADDLLLGIDVGTTNIKALVFTVSGALAASASVATPTERPQPGWAEHDPRMLWQSVVEVIRRALEFIDDPGGCAGWRWRASARRACCSTRAAKR